MPADEKSVKACEAEEATLTVPRSMVMTCWLGTATGSCEVTDSGSSEANLLAAESSVSRLMVSFSPSSVRLAPAPWIESVGAGHGQGDPELLEQAC